MDSTRWQDPAWLRTVSEWTDGELDRLGLRRVGEVEQPHVRPWSTVIRIPTETGDVWFKANDATLSHEVRVATLLSARMPELVPPLLAADPDSGWMLMPDAGEKLRTVVPRERSLARWLDVLPRYAALQLAAVDDVDAMLAAGVPDMRLDVLPEKYEQLVSTVDVEQRFRDAVPHVASLCERLAAFGIDETIQHDDLHDAQVFLADGAHLVLDWGDACISHPFFTLSVTLEGLLSWGLDDEEDSEDTAPYRDAYLEPFAHRYDADLVEAATVATRLGWACRAVNGHIPGDDQSTRNRLAMFLDGRV
jgi:phosphotransferase family enzyme